MKTRINNIIYTVSLGFIAWLPSLSFAQAPGNDIRTLIRFLSNLFQNILIPMMIALALIYIILAVIRYIGANEDSNAREERRQQIFWGIIGLFVIMSVWYLIGVVQNTFRIFGGGTLQ